MRAWRSSFGALLWTQAIYVTVILVLVGFAFTTRSATATTETGATGANPTTATAPVPVAVAGSVVGAGDGLVGVQEVGAAQPVAFAVGADAELSRGGDVATLADLRPGDEVWLTVDGRTGRVLRLDAQPVAAATRSGPSDGLALVAALGLIVGAAALVVRHRAAVAGDAVETGRRLPRPVGRRLGLVRQGVGSYARPQRPALRA